MAERVEIGDCVLWCGDSLEIIESIGPLDAIVTDPPYGIAFRSNHRKVRHEAIANDASGDALAWAVGLQVIHSKYIFCRWDNLADVPKPKSCITWVKNNWSMGDLEHEHARQTEVCLFYPGPNHYFPAGRPTDVLEVRRTGNEFHPTEKPVDLMSAIVRWTVGTVCDPFTGAGATAIACAKLGRKFIGIELDRRYFDIAAKRIEQAYAQPDLFISQAPKYKQMGLLDGA